MFYFIWRECCLLPHYNSFILLLGVFQSFSNLSLSKLYIAFFRYCCSLFLDLSLLNAVLNVFLCMIFMMPEKRTSASEDSECVDTSCTYNVRELTPQRAEVLMKLSVCCCC